MSKKLRLGRPLPGTLPGEMGMGSPMRRLLLALTCAGTVLALVPSASSAITGGQPDDSLHPAVGGTVLYYPPRNETIVNCTGTLISDTVFVTAAHCGRHATRRRVTFDEVFNASSSPTHWGTFMPTLTTTLPSPTARTSR